LFKIKNEENTLIVGKLDYEKIEFEEQKDENAGVFEKIINYLTEENKDLGIKDKNIKNNFKQIVNMCLKKLENIIKSASKKGEEIIKYEEYKQIISEFLSNISDIESDQKLKIHEKNSHSSDSENEFMVYREKEKEKSKPKPVHYTAEPLISRPEIPKSKHTEIMNTKNRKISKEIQEINEKFNEKEYTLADMIGVKGDDKKSKKSGKPLENKKLKPIDPSVCANPMLAEEEKNLDKPKDSIEKLIKQEQDEKELEFILKEIEYQENLEKVLAESKKEAEINAIVEKSEKIEKIEQNEENEIYEQKYYSRGAYKNRRGYRGGIRRGQNYNYRQKNYY